jgi:RNA polymerase sigma factor (sigma-70 family)
MPKNSSDVEQGPEAPGRAARIRTAVAEGHDQLLHLIAVIVVKTERPGRWADVLERAEEVLDEAVGEALQDAQRFNPSLSVVPWICGIAANVLKTRRRKEKRARRCVTATALGEEAWQAALRQLCLEPESKAVDGHLDLEQALGRLTPEQRRAIELRYYQGLDGEALARALETPTTGAARVRVCRAMLALRAQFLRAEGEL